MDGDVQSNVIIDINGNMHYNTGYALHNHHECTNSYIMYLMPFPTKSHFAVREPDHDAFAQLSKITGY